MAEAGLPCCRAAIEPIADAEAAAKVAADIGYPVIVKAVAGGGGRGMRVVDDPGDLPRRYREIRGTAQALFGDDRVYVERYLPSARHVEVQVLCDAHGNGVHLGQRDCSVQRRRQKIIEETPAPGLPPERGRADGRGRRARALLAAGYVGAGTFEFLVDDEGRFYFMEVNCRIQVEHPVTEMITGVDLVREQLRIAAGEPLGSRPGRHGARAAWRSSAGSTPRTRRATSCPRRARSTELRLPGGPFVRVDTDARARRPDLRRATTRCWPRSSCGRRTGRRRSPGCAGRSTSSTSRARACAPTATSCAPCWTTRCSSPGPTTRPWSTDLALTDRRRPTGGNPMFTIDDLMALLVAKVGPAPRTRTDDPRARRSPTWGWTPSRSCNCRRSSRPLRLRASRRPAR